MEAADPHGDLIRLSMMSNLGQKQRDKLQKKNLLRNSIEFYNPAEPSAAHSSIENDWDVGSARQTPNPPVEIPKKKISDKLDEWPEHEDQPPEVQDDQVSDW